MPAEPPLNQRLSVVLLAYNCAHRITPIIDELRALELPIIAVDNASADGTADVLEAAGIQVVRLAGNLGASARNAGLARVDTPYAAFCDDDSWFEAAGLSAACDLFDRHPRLALLNGRILVGEGNHQDPISTEMAATPLTDSAGIPGGVLMGFMAGACIIRAAAYLQAGGYDPRLFMGGEEEGLAFTLLKQGWQLRYAPWLAVHHHPSLANFQAMRHYGLRNTLWTAWLHRRLPNAIRYTVFVLADAPKNAGYLRALLMTARGLPWVLRERRPMSRELDTALRQLDRRRFAQRRKLLTFADRAAADPASW